MHGVRIWEQDSHYSLLANTICMLGKCTALQVWKVMKVEVAGLK